MIRRQTWVILGLFVILLAGAVFWQQTKLKNAPEETSAVPTTVPEEYLFDQTGAPISRLLIQRSEDGTTLEMLKQEGAWALVQPKAEATDSTTIESMISSLLSARIIAKPSGATDLVVLGLQPPAYRIVVGLESGQQIVINVGKASSVGTGYYVLTPDRVVYTVNKFGLDSLIHMLDYPPALPTPTLEPTLEATAVLTETIILTDTQSLITPTP